MSCGKWNLNACSACLFSVILGLFFCCCRLSICVCNRTHYVSCLSYFPLFPIRIFTLCFIVSCLCVSVFVCIRSKGERENRANPRCVVSFDSILFNFHISLWRAPNWAWFSTCTSQHNHTYRKHTMLFSLRAYFILMFQFDPFIFLLFHFISLALALSAEMRFKMYGKKQSREEKWKWKWT